MQEKSLKQKVHSSLVTIVIVGAFLGIWEALVRCGIADPFFVSKPSSIASDFFNIFLTGTIVPHLKITLYEALSGILYGSVIGIVVAFILGNFKFAARVLDPIIVALYSIPKLTLAPLFILWFGIGVESKVFLATVEVFFLVFFNTYAGLQNVDKDLINAVKLMGANRGQIMIKVILPSSVPWIFTGIRVSFAVALIGALVGEYMGASEGLGWMVQHSSGMFDITRIMTCILILMLVMQILNGLLKLLEGKILKWRPSNS